MKNPGKDRRTKQNSDKNKSRIPTAEKVSEKIEMQDGREGDVKRDNVKSEKKKNDRRYRKRPQGGAPKVSENSGGEKK